MFLLIPELESLGLGLDAPRGEIPTSPQLEGKEITASY